MNDEIKKLRTYTAVRAHERNSMFEQKVIKIHNEAGIILDEINALTGLNDLREYGLPGYSVAYIEQIAPIHAMLVFVLIRCVRSSKRIQPTRSRALKSNRTNSPARG